jgi:cobalt-zinc-cadmium efflux system membrane fusion protein
MKYTLKFNAKYIHLRKCITLLFSGVIFIVSACSQKTETQSDQTIDSEENSITLSQEQFKAGKMELGKISDYTFHDHVKTSGYFEVPPEDNISITSFIGGTVNRIAIKEGQSVKKGDLLFTLITPEFIKMQQEYVELNNQMEYLESEFKRQQNLNKEQVTSEKDFQRIKSEYLTVKAKQNGLKQTLKLLNVNTVSIANGEIQSELNFYAPISGNIVSVPINKGAYLNTEQVAMTLINTNNMHLRLRVFEDDIAKIEVEQKIQFSLNDKPSDFFAGKVENINKIVSEQNGAVNVYASFIGTNINKIIPGMYVNAFIDVARQTKKALPADAFVSIEKSTYVLVLQKITTDSTYYFDIQTIEPGRSDGKFLEIINYSNYEPNTQFVVTGAFNLIHE